MGGCAREGRTKTHFRGARHHDNLSATHSPSSSLQPCCQWGPRARRCHALCQADPVQVTLRGPGLPGGGGGDRRAFRGHRATRVCDRSVSEAGLGVHPMHHRGRAVEPGAWGAEGELPGASGRLLVYPSISLVFQPALQ